MTGLTNAFLNLDGYELKVQDRAVRGGGILLYASINSIGNSLVPGPDITTVNQCVNYDIQSSTGDVVSFPTIRVDEKVSYE